MMITLSALGANTSKYVFVSVEGETLTSVFKRAGLSTSTLYKVLDADDKNVLARLKTGSEIEFFVDSDKTKKEMNSLEQAQSRTTKKITGLEHFSYEDRLREPGLLT